jgi:hypothetical protein
MFSLQRLSASSTRLSQARGLAPWAAIGLPSLVDIDLDGRRVIRGARVWSIGTWPLKAAFYADVKEGIKAGADADPEGLLSFSDVVEAACCSGPKALRLGRVRKLPLCDSLATGMARHGMATNRTKRPLSCPLPAEWMPGWLTA